jgi:elongation of very long chain fatty acids protein 6
MFWTTVFTLSKYIELFDTVLLILKNPEKKLPFLHWWHHLTVLLFSWYAGSNRMSSGFTFAFMNSFVHTFMYFYYYLTFIGSKPSWGIYLTILQVNILFKIRLLKCLLGYLSIFIGSNHFFQVKFVIVTVHT